VIKIFLENFFENHRVVNDNFDDSRVDANRKITPKVNAWGEAPTVHFWLVVLGKK